MKGRSHRLPISEPPDDWGDGSWTVDCVCGVTFDDGEEMVNCDECGVWVHTRCSRFVKGETSFACDKCKSKKLRNNDTEETEVAQLLVELPTKTVQMDPPCPPAAPSRRPLRLWTDLPMEERVHVHGVPGDPALFQGLSSVFTSQLWKCTGYVPKKFNFQYREFPCWEESENPVDRGAGVLFSLSKQVLPFERKLPAKEGKKLEGESDNDFRGGPALNCMKRERNHLRLASANLGKRKKEEFGALKDRSSKRKALSTEIDAEKKRGSAPICDSGKVEQIGTGIVKSDSTDSQYPNGEERKESMRSKLKEDDIVSDVCGSEKAKNSLIPKVSTEIASHEFAVHTVNPDGLVKVQNVCQEHTVKGKTSQMIDVFVASLTETNEKAQVVIKSEDTEVAVDCLNCLNENQNAGDLNGGCAHTAVVSVPGDTDTKTGALDLQGHCVPSQVSGLCSSSVLDVVKMKKQEEEYQCTPVPDLQSSIDQGKHSLSDLGKSSSKRLAGNADPHDTVANCGDHRIIDPDRGMDKKATAVGIVSGSADSNQREQGAEHLTRYVAVQGGSAEVRHGVKLVDSKYGGASAGKLAPNPQKVVSGAKKSPLTSCGIIQPKPSASGSHKSHFAPVSAVTLKPAHSSKQRVKVNTTTDRRKEHGSADTSKDDSTKSSNFGKTSNTGRISHSSGALKQGFSDLKEQVLSQLPKPLGTQNAGSMESGEAYGSSLIQIDSLVENKPIASSMSQKSEKVLQSNFVPASKLLHSAPSLQSTMQGSASTALSDEELALLLHQELNSSPRVPRVPRMRQAGGIAHLVSPTAASLHARRPSGSGGKDHIMFSRRKSKEDMYKGSRSREPVDEIKRSDRLHPSSKQDGSPETVASGKKPILGASNISNSCPSGPHEVNEKSPPATRSSPTDTSDDDAIVTAAASIRTLPGLIDEIMSKGKRMTYEELCDAVLPHWNNLRKHNGERYAYASHSQAVQDCLRNRNEWAHLIDRGPKTNSGRKRHKLDSDTSVETEDDVKDSLPKEMEVSSVRSHKEEFPKGKRKARKRRRLALQGRGVKDIRERQKVEATTTEDELEATSHSSEATESLSEDDSHGDGGTGPPESYAPSSSSDEAG